MPCNIKKNLSQHPNRRSELITSGGGLLFFYDKIKARSAREMHNNN